MKRPSLDDIPNTDLDVLSELDVSTLEDLSKEMAVRQKQLKKIEKAMSAALLMRYEDQLEKTTGDSVVIIDEGVTVRAVLGQYLRPAMARIEVD